MRLLSSQALLEINTAKGSRPNLVIEIDWGSGVYNRYGDKFDFDNHVEGSILSVSPIDDIINVSGSGASQSINIILDDTRGELKSIFDQTDIHNKSARVYQWYEGMPFSDRFLIFSGSIAAPISWSEGDRKLAFSILSKIEDKEIGFSAEEGDFDDIPVGLVGRVWPHVFGTVYNLPAMQLDAAPKGVTLDGTGIVDPNLLLQISDLDQQIANLYGEAQKAATESNRVRNIGAPNPPAIEDQDAINQSDSLREQANSLLQQAASLQETANNLRYVVMPEQVAAEKPSIRVHNGELFPQSFFEVELNGALYGGTMVGANYMIDYRIHPGIRLAYKDSLAITKSLPKFAISDPTIRQLFPGKFDVNGGFHWADAGTDFKIYGAFPVRWIAAGNPCTVLAVSAYRQVSGHRVLTTLPSNYYSVSYQNFGSITATIVTTHRPLSDLNQGWDDQIYCTLRSNTATIGGVSENPVEVIKWAIAQTATTYDPTSFALAASQLTAYPMNFALTEKMEALNFIRDIAYQARCTVWARGGIWFIRFLPVTPAVSKTIDEANLLTNTMEITTTPTEQLATVYTAEYRTTYETGESNKIILRNNVTRYGTHKKTFRFYAYNNPQLVQHVATFWLIRESNLFKRIAFESNLDMIELETFDAIALNFSNSWIANSSVVGVIESAQYDSSSYKIKMTVWTPVRVGEMTQYLGATPVDSISFLYPTAHDDPGGGGIGVNASGSLKSQNGSKFQATQRGVRRRNSNQKRHDHGDSLPGQASSDFNDQPEQPPGAAVSTDARPTFNYSLPQLNSTSVANVDMEPWTAPAEIVSGTGPEYQLKIYRQGLDNPSIDAPGTNADPQDVLPAGTKVMASSVVWKDSQGNPTRKIYFVPGAGDQRVFPCEIVSGTANSYQCKLYTGALNSSSYREETVTQMQIHPQEVIPPGTYTIAILTKYTDESGTPQQQFTMQLPVFIAG